jgi:hypothetical protein
VERCGAYRVGHGCVAHGRRGEAQHDIVPAASLLSRARAGARLGIARGHRERGGRVHEGMAAEADVACLDSRECHADAVAVFAASFLRERAAEVRLEVAAVRARARLRSPAKHQRVRCLTRWHRYAAQDKSGSTQCLRRGRLRAWAPVARAAAPLTGPRCRQNRRARHAPRRRMQ